MPEYIEEVTCALGQICFHVDIFVDPDNIESINVSPPGATYNADNSTICFTPEFEGDHVIELTVVDLCGMSATGITTVSVDVIETPVIDCPIEPFAFTICEPAEICIDLPITPIDATITPSMGEYRNGRLCFFAEVSGTYNIEITAETLCGTTSCTVTLNIDLEETPVIDCPIDPFAFTVCEPTELCIDLPITPVDAVITPSIGTYANGQLCFFAETPGTYNIDITAETQCGTVTCTITINVDFEEIPIIDCPIEPFAFTLCEPAELCIDLPITPLDAVITPSMGTYSNGQLCFFAEIPGTYNIDVTAETQCGTVSCQVVVEVDFEEVPVIDCPIEPLAFTLCEPSELCIDLPITPVDAVITPSIGTYSNGQLCFFAEAPGTYNIDVTAETQCGTTTCTVVINVEFDEIPVIDCPSGPFAVTICEPAEVCVDLPIALGNAVISTSMGTYQDGQLCFFAEAPGAYSIDVTAETQCGTATCTVVINVDFEDAPVIDCPVEPIAFTICEPTELCVDLPVTPAGAIVTPSIGTYVDGQLCFFAAAPGSYSIDVMAETQCGTTTCTVVINVDFEDAPVVDCPIEPIAFTICEPAELCVDLPITPVDAIITPSVGTYTNGQLCFFAEAPGTYNIDVTAETQCGTTTCTVVIKVYFEEVPVIDCPVDPIAFTVCAPSELCVDLPITPAGAVVTPSIGTYVDGQLCFFAETPGTYNIDVTAETQCGTASCTVVIDVNFEEVPVINCPIEPVTFKVCEPAELCVDLPITPANAIITTSIGTYTNGQLCFFAETAGTYYIDVTAETQCGTTTCTVEIEVIFEEIPVIDCPLEPFSFTVCEPTELCIDLPVTPVNAVITPSMGTYSNGQLCFFADAPGSYSIDITAETQCGTTSCTVVLNVDFDEVPVIDCPVDPVAFVFCGPSEFCIDLPISHNDAVIDVTGGVYKDGQLCLTAEAPGTYDVYISATTSCGFAECTVTFILDEGLLPNIVCPEDIQEFICGPATLCYPIEGIPYGAEVIVSPTSATFDPETNTICFDTDCSVEKILGIEVIAECGSITCEFTVSVTMNSEPLVFLGDDYSETLCAPEEICIPAGVSDADYNIVSYLVTPQEAYYNPISGRICYTPTETGSYMLILEAIDECGASSTDTVSVNIVMNESPVVTAPTSIDRLLCELTDVCFPVEISDPQNNISEITILPGGSYNKETGEVCFTPGGAGLFEITTTVVDSCGVSSSAITLINITVEEAPVIDCPIDPFAFTICEPTQLCIDLPITPSYATITPSIGTYQDGQLCFLAETPGTFSIDITAETQCGIVSCTVVINVDFEDVPVIDCPIDPIAFTVCEPTELCVDLPITPLDAVVTPSIGTYANGQLCFFAEGPGTYNIDVTAETQCGTVNCTVVINVDFEEVPVIDCPVEPISRFLCQPETICIDLPITPASAVVTTSFGTYQDGQLCFPANESGIITIDVTAVTDCGQNQCTVTIDVEIGEAPEITCPVDPIPIFICEPGIICHELIITPIDAVVTLSAGTYANGQLCLPVESSGIYQVDVEAVTDCGTANCTIIFDVEIGVAPELTCPGNSQEFLCGPGEICRTVDVIPPDAQVTVSPVGYYLDGEVCFYADNEGLYTITVEAVTGCGQTSCTFSVDVTFNDTPVVIAGPDFEVFQCVFEEICFTPENISDPDGTTPDITVSQPGYYNQQTGQICFTPAGAGEYCLEITATDDCGATATDITCITVTTGEAAVIECPPEPIDRLLCEPGEICIPIATIPSTAVIEVSRGSYADGQLCFQAEYEGTYEIDVTATDACGTDQCTIIVNVVFGDVAEIICPDLPVSVSLCEPGQVDVTLPISPATAEVTAIPVGSYNFDTGKLSFYADATGQYVITVTASAPCGDDVCEVVVDVAIEDVPQITCPESIDAMVCLADSPEVCFEVDVISSTAEVTVSPAGYYSGGMVCVPVSSAGSQTFTVTASNACGEDACDVTVNVTDNQPPVLTVPEDIFIPSCNDNIEEICLDGIVAVDPEDDELTITNVCGPGTYIPARPDSGEICFTPESNDATYDFCVAVFDGCQTVTETFSVTIYPSNVCETCLDVSIATDSCYVVGSIVPVRIMTNTYEEIGGFDLLISYDASVMAFFSVQQGSAIQDWEYFTYTLNDENCGAACPSGMIRIVAIADLANPGTHPPSEQLMPTGELAVFHMRLSHDQNVGGQFLPISFHWLDCGDNGFSSTSGTYLYVDAIIYDAFGSVIWDESDDDLFPEESRIDWAGAPDTCMEGGKKTPIRCVEFHNGGICVKHPDEIDDRGDLNLNGVAYEISDAVVYTNYFIYGFAAFQVNIDGQIAASDVNADGISLTVADLVYLIRVITGDAVPNPKVAPEGSRVMLAASTDVDNLEVFADLNYTAGAGLLVFEHSGVIPESPILKDLAQNMDMIYTVTDSEVRVLLYSFEAGSRISTGSGQLLDIGYSGDGYIKLKEAVFAGYNGEDLSTIITTKLLPSEYRLSQNYPNPFNPSTSIDMSLPQAGRWQLTIFNAAGQIVKRMEGYAESGRATVVWDGTNYNGNHVATGIYFYRFEAGDFRQTRKMILLK
jgi:hypothetical protein